MLILVRVGPYISRNSYYDHQIKINVIWLYENFYALLCCRTKIEFSAGGELFQCTGQRVTVKGFTSIMPWLAVSEKNLPQVTKGEKIKITKVELYEASHENFVS